MELRLLSAADEQVGDRLEAYLELLRSGLAPGPVHQRQHRDGPGLQPGDRLAAFRQQRDVGLQQLLGPPPKPLAQSHDLREHVPMLHRPVPPIGRLKAVGSAGLLAHAEPRPAKLPPRERLHRRHRWASWHLLQGGGPCLGGHGLAPKLPPASIRRLQLLCLAGAAGGPGRVIGPDPSEGLAIAGGPLLGEPGVPAIASANGGRDPVLLQRKLGLPDEGPPDPRVEQVRCHRRHLRALHVRSELPHKLSPDNCLGSSGVHGNPAEGLELPDPPDQEPLRSVGGLAGLGGRHLLFAAGVTRLPRLLTAAAGGLVEVQGGLPKDLPDRFD